MPKLSATEAVFTHKGNSHWVTLEHGESLTKEEVYFTVEATWRGDRVSFEIEATRYKHSGGWSDWRIYVRSGLDSFTEPQSRAFNEVGKPMVEQWLGSDEYPASRQRAFYNSIRSVVREERYSVDKSERLLAKLGNELSVGDLASLTIAVGHLRDFLEAVKA